MGKTRVPPPGAGTQAAERRQLARELNEATQAAMQARRDLATQWDEVHRLRQVWQKDLETDLLAFIDNSGKEVRTIINHEVEHIKTMFDDAENAVRVHQSQILGCDTPEALLKSLVDGVAKLMNEALDRAVARLESKMDKRLGEIERQARKAATLTR